jgi:uncharacterized protein involved in exopolysaccharide biosynthesis
MSADPYYGDQESGGQLPDFLLDPLGVARRRWIPMALCAAVGLVATLVAVIVWNPVYLAQATVLITSQQIPRDFVRPTVEVDDLANINAMLGEALSADRLSSLIDRLGLFPDAAGKAARIDLVNAMRSRIEASPQRNNTSDRSQSIVYAISYQSGAAQEAADVTNALATLFVEVSVARRNSQARRATEFLRDALARTEKELREQSRLVTEFRQAHRGELPEEQETHLRRLELLSAQRDSLSRQITAAEDRVLSISTRGVDSSEADFVLNDLRRQLAREIAIHTDEHPNVIALRDRLKRLAESDRNASLPAATSHMVADERRELGHLREQRAQIDAELAQINQRIDRIPRTAEQLTALQQKETVLREDYTAGLRKVEQAELAENLEAAKQGAQVSILDSAMPPTSPKFPRWLVLLAGLALTAGLAIAVAMLFELIDPVVIGQRQIEKLSDRPILGTLPLMAES